MSHFLSSAPILAAPEMRGKIQPVFYLDILHPHFFNCSQQLQTHHGCMSVETRLRPDCKRYTIADLKCVPHQSSRSQFEFRNGVQTPNTSHVNPQERQKIACKKARALGEFILVLIFFRLVPLHRQITTLSLCSCRCTKVRRITTYGIPTTLESPLRFARGARSPI
jgi:hypothetical protein